MKTSFLVEKLREHGIYNIHNLLTRFILKGENIVACCYQRRPEGRAGIAQSNKTQVFSPFHKTDPESGWCDYGCKSFVGIAKESMPKAVQWASEKYGIKEMGCIPI